MIWIEFLKSTCKPKKVKKNPTCKPIKPDHPPEPINGRLADGLSVNLFSTDGQRISPKPDPPDPNLTLTSHMSWNVILELDSFDLSLDDLIFNEFAFCRLCICLIFD